MSKRKRRVTVGDVFSLVVDRGLAHIQAIGVHPRYKQQWIVRVLDKIYARASDDAAEIASGSDSYTVFVGDLSFAEREGQLRYVGHAELPENHKRWQPLIRGNASHHSYPQRQEHWWIDDGVKSRKIGRLSKEQESLTNGTFVPPLSLIRKINRGWDPNWEFKGEGAAEFLYPETPTVPEGEPVARFFLLFPNKTKADAATAALGEWDRSFEIEAFDDDNDDDDDAEDKDADEKNPDDAKLPFMLVVSTTRSFINIDELTDFEDRLESLASALDGMYDGNEIPIPVKR